MALTHVALRASKVLTSAYVTSGAQPLNLNPYVALYCTYTRAADPGAVGIKIQFSADNGTTFWNQGVILVGTVTTGVDTAILVQQSYYLYKATAAGAETFVVDLSDQYSSDLLVATHIRISAREDTTGTPATPGTLAVTMCIGTRP